MHFLYVDVLLLFLRAPQFLQMYLFFFSLTCFFFYNLFHHGQCSEYKYISFMQQIVHRKMPTIVTARWVYCRLYQWIISCIAYRMRTFTSFSKRLKKTLVLQLCQQPGSSQLFRLYFSCFAVQKNTIGLAMCKFEHLNFSALFHAINNFSSMFGIIMF